MVGAPKHGEEKGIVHVYMDAADGSGHTLAMTQVKASANAEFGKVARVSADGKVLAVSDWSGAGTGMVHLYDILG